MLPRNRADHCEHTFDSDGGACRHCGFTVAEIEHGSRGGFSVLGNDPADPLDKILRGKIAEWIILHVGNTGLTEHNMNLLIEELVRVFEERRGRDR